MSTKLVFIGSLEKYKSAASELYDVIKEHFVCLESLKKYRNETKFMPFTHNVV